MGCRHSSEDSSAPTIPPHWVRVSSTRYMLLSFMFWENIRNYLDLVKLKKTSLVYLIKDSNIVSIKDHVLP